MRFAFLIGLLASCAGNETSSTTASRAMPAPPAFNPQQAQAQADIFLRTLYPGQQVNGPVCMPEAVVDGMTQCSFTTRLAGDGPLQVGTILCGNTGCREGEAPVVVQQDLLPPQQATGNTTIVQNHGGVDNDWLFWYLLWNNGATTHHYHSWYTTTPVVYRSAYYTRGYVPAPAAVSGYRTNYSRAVTTSSSSKYSYKSSGSYKTTPPSSSYKTTPSSSTSRTSGSTKTTSGSPKPTSSGYKSTPKPAPSRSSGFSSPSRSSGFRSGGRR